VERIAVMAALNLAHELERERAASVAPDVTAATDGIDVPVLLRRIAGMQAAIDQVLTGKERRL
jgi:cell division protein ZapA (FtsZ GTPase activity inhibitor)